MESPRLRELIGAGTVRAPTEHGMPDLAPDLAEDVPSLSDLVIADRDKERRGAEHLQAAWLVE